MLAPKYILSALKFVITLGGSIRYIEAASQYDAIYARYKATFDIVDPLSKQLQISSEQIEADIASLETVIKKSSSLHGTNYYIPSISNSKQDPIQALNSFNTKYNIIANTMTSSALSLATLSSAWLSVGAIGTASTGAAISGLSGIAASNATLAWFGFGSLASGGLGMAGGQITLVILGVAIMWFLIAYTVHKKANKINDKNDEVLNEMGRLQELLPELKAQATTLDSHCTAINKLTNNYLAFAQSCESRIYPNGLISKIKQKIFIFIGLKPYSKKQHQAVKELKEATRILFESLSRLITS